MIPLQPASCECGQPLPVHLLGIMECGVRHVCSCERAYNERDGVFVRNGHEVNPIARFDRAQMTREPSEHMIVHVLGVEMRRKLRLNGHKPDWTAEGMLSLFDGLEREVGELRAALDAVYRDFYTDKPVGDELIEAVVSECADVANFAAMIADKTRKRRLK